jgi:alcohol dehydrogenase (NADP+)
MEFFPIAPGHEIAGVIAAVGTNVSKFAIGDEVAVGCFVDSCGTCGQCGTGSQNHCRNGVTMTYGSVFPVGRGHDDDGCAGYHTNGGYSSNITVTEQFVFRVPSNLGLAYVAPLMCAGITMFAPLNEHVLNGQMVKNVGIIGFGGLGQMGVKLAKKMGCDNVVVFSRSMAKQAAAEALGAKLIAHTDADAMKAAADSLDLIIDTVSTSHDISKYFDVLTVGGTYHFIGAVPQPAAVSPFTILLKRLKIGGSLVGGIPETQQMLDFCALHDIKPTIRIIAAADASAHFQALAAGTVDAERVVIDMSTLADLTHDTAGKEEKEEAS